MSEPLPKGWATAELGDLGIWGSGGTPSRNDEKAYGGTIPWIKIGDLPDGRVIATEETITDHGLRNSSAKMLDEETLLIAMYGASIGKLGITTMPCTTNQAIASCKPHRGINLRYLFYLALSERHNLIAKGQGGAQPNISQTILKEFDVPIAPENQQVRIVSKIDELFSEIEEGERALERVRKLIERYRQSVLKAAVTGELTRAWREKHKDQLESGEALLARILKTRREAWETAELKKMKAKGQKAANNWKSRYTDPRAPDISDLPDLPESWAWASMDSLTHDFITGPFGSALHKSDYIEGGTPLINPINLRDRRITADPQITVSSETVARLSRYMLKRGDIILARRGEMGRCAQVTEVEEGWMCGTGSAILRCTGEILPGYAALAISSGHSQKFLEGNCAGTTMHNLNQDAMARLPIPMPCVAEQEACMELIAEQLEDINVFKSACELEMKRLKALRQSILMKAFRGELIPQDPADESASNLLERIATEKAAPENRRKTATRSPRATKEKYEYCRFQCPRLQSLELRPRPA